MTRFNKNDFTKSGDYIFYGADRKFVARFKYKNAPVTKAKFLKQLIANHTVEGYFAEYDKGITPLAILKNADPTWYTRITKKT